LPAVKPMPLQRRRVPFSNPDWLFELKYDGFRAICCVECGVARLISRRGNTYKSFPVLSDAIARELKAKDALLDGEIVCLDQNGKPQFNELLFRRGEPRFYAFDVLWLDGCDLREKPLLKRKGLLRRLIPKRSVHLLYVDHVEECGEELFEAACRNDLEGIVAKLKSGAYTSDSRSTTWVKIKNPAYTQAQSRDELFEALQSGR
jgi:bifunctional non-homologous end joining protein LigD